MKKTAYKNKREQGWKFSASDMPIIRHITKSYKKRQNKHKKESERSIEKSTHTIHKGISSLSVNSISQTK